MKKCTRVKQHQSVTPQKTHHCSYQESSYNLYGKRLSFLLSSLHTLHTATKIKEAALRQEYLQINLRNSSQIKEARTSLAASSQELWRSALESVRKARSLRDVQMAVAEANKAVWARVRASRVSESDCSLGL